MNNSDGLLDKLSRLLADNSIGLDLLAARPRGNRLSPEIRESIEALLDGLDKKHTDMGTSGSDEDRSSTLIYGNSCFAVRRYETAVDTCLLYTSPSPRDLSTSRMPSSA